MPEDVKSQKSRKHMRDPLVTSEGREWLSMISVEESRDGPNAWN